MSVSLRALFRVIAASVILGLAFAPAQFVAADEAATPVAFVTAEPTTEPDTTPEAVLTPEATVEATIDATQESTVEVNSGLVEPAGGGNSVVLLIRDQDGNPINGTCWNVYDEVPGTTPDIFKGQVCDSDDSSSDGAVHIDGSLFANTSAHYANPVSTPAGFAPCKGLFCSNLFYPSSPNLEVTVTLTALANLTIYKIDENSNPLPGACFELFPFGDPVCDDDDGFDDGTIVIEDLGPDNYTLIEGTAPAGYFTAPNRPVTINGDDIEITVADVPLSVAGSLTVSKVGESDQMLPDSCFSVVGAEDQLTYAERCDSTDDPDGIINDGDLFFGPLPPGNYNLIETRAPDGYGLASEAFEVEIETDVQFTIEVQNLPEANLVVHKVDDIGNPVVGVCFRLRLPNDPVDAYRSQFCDSNDGDNDGDSRTIPESDNLAPGDYFLTEDSTPSGYFDTPGMIVTLASGDNAVTFVNTRQFSMRIAKSDPDGEPLLGACFTMTPVDDQGNEIEVCDDELQENWNGEIEFPALEAGEYILTESQVPEGYVGILPQLVSIVDEDLDLAIRDGLESDVANVVISKIDEDDEALSDSCFELYLISGDQSIADAMEGLVVAEACDASDADSDGTITFDPLPAFAGETTDYVLVETVAPEGYEAADPKVITVSSGQNKVTVQDFPAGYSPDPSPTPDDEDDEEDVTTLPTTGAGAGPMETGIVLAGWGAIALLMAGAILARRRRNV